MSKDHPIQVSINRTVRGKASGDKAFWRHYNSQFQPIRTTAHGLAVEIWRGYAFAPIYFRDRRTKENFEMAYHIAFDFDRGDVTSSLERLVSDSFFQLYGSFAYSTPSSTAEKPKSRVVFVLEEPITDLVEYESLYRAMLKLRYNATDDVADKSVKDGARLFFGSPNCNLIGNWQLLDAETVRGMIEMYEEAHLLEISLEKVSAIFPVDPAKGGDLFKAKVSSMQRNLARAADGTKHLTLLKAAYAMGGYVAAGYIDPQSAQNALENAVGMMNGVNNKEAAYRTIRSGLEAGKARPLYLDSGSNGLGELFRQVVMTK